MGWEAVIHNRDHKTVAIKELNGSFSLPPVWISFIDMRTNVLPRPRALGDTVNDVGLRPVWTEMPEDVHGLAQLHPRKSPRPHEQL